MSVVYTALVSLQNAFNFPFPTRGPYWVNYHFFLLTVIVNRQLLPIEQKLQSTGGAKQLLIFESSSRFSNKYHYKNNNQRKSSRVHNEKCRVVLCHEQFWFYANKQIRGTSTKIDMGQVKQKGRLRILTQIFNSWKMKMIVTL